MDLFSDEDLEFDLSLAEDEVKMLLLWLRLDSLSLFVLWLSETSTKLEFKLN